MLLQYSLLIHALSLLQYSLLIHTLSLLQYSLLIHTLSLLQYSLSVAIEALKAFLTHTESEVMLKFLEQNNAWTMLESEDTCPHGCLHLARYLTIKGTCSFTCTYMYLLKGHFSKLSNCTFLLQRVL